MVIGIGGQYAFGGNIPLFGIQIPCIAGAAIFGILLNLILSIGSKKKSEGDGGENETEENSAEEITAEAGTDAAQ